MLEMRDPVIVEFPLRGEWFSPNTPGTRIPSHGTNKLGTRYAYDFIQVDWSRPGNPDAGIFYTNNAGEIILGGLEPGMTITAQEVKTVDGYVLDGNPQSIKIEAGAAQNLTFWNKPAGSLVIRKLDKLTGKPLAGVEFEAIYAEGGYVDNENGHLSSNGLAEVERGTLAPEDFMAGIASLVGDLVRDYQPVSGAAVLFPPGKESVGPCPRCGGAVTESKKGFFCENPSCRFVLWKDSRFFAAKKKALTKAVAAALLSKGRVRLTGCYSEKTGKTYDATALLEDDGERTNFKLVFDDG